MRIHGQLDRETYRQIQAGAVSEFPLEWDFIRTGGGPVSSHELLVLLYQAYGDKPFIITVEPSDVEPRSNPFHREFLSDKLRERDIQREAKL